MNTPLICLLAIVTAGAEDPGPTRVHSPSPVFAAALRGQSPADYGQPVNYAPNNYAPNLATTPLQTPTYAPPLQVAQVMNPPPAYVGGDPFAIPQSGMTPYVTQPLETGFMPGGSYYGTGGPEPIRFGWSSKYDLGYLPDANADSPFGDFNVFEFDMQLKRTWHWPWDTAFSWSPEFNYRNWGGPAGLPLPASVYRFASDLQLTTSTSGPFSMELGLTPQVASDFDGSTSNDAWMWDVRGALFIRMGPQWTWAIGAQYWDRVDSIVTPYAGFVWRPDDRWEFTLVLPRPRIDYFMGQSGFGPTWLYARGEYRVEGYETNLAGTGLRNRMQISDYRALIGFRNYGPCASGFIEAGWVFNREIIFDNATPSVDINSGFITRLGLRF